MTLPAALIVATVLTSANSELHRFQIELGGGIAPYFAPGGPGPASLVTLGGEFRFLPKNEWFLSTTLRVDWRHWGFLFSAPVSNLPESAYEIWDLLAGLRIGLKAGSRVELFASLEVGPVLERIRVAEYPYGERGSFYGGIGFRGGFGMNVTLWSRFIAFVLAEAGAQFYPVWPATWPFVHCTTGVGVRL